MTIELPAKVEAKLRDLASKQGQSPHKLAEEAIREYLEVAAITDLEPAEIAEAQSAMITELGSRGAGSRGG